MLRGKQGKFGNLYYYRSGIVGFRWKIANFPIKNTLTSESKKVQIRPIERIFRMRLKLLTSADKLPTTTRNKRNSARYLIIETTF